MAPCLLPFQKSNVFVNCGSADVADPRKLGHIQLLALICGIVAKEGGGDVLFAHLRTPDLPSYDLYDSSHFVWGLLSK